MKKLAFLSLMFMVCKAHALTNLKDFQQWRSSETANTDSIVRVATAGPIILWDVTVASGSFGSGTKCSFQYYNSTITDSVTRNQNTSTSTVYDTANSGAIFEIGETLTGTFWYRTTGTCSIRIRWDYFYSPPKGKEKLGLKQ